MHCTQYCTHAQKNKEVEGRRISRNTLFTSQTINNRWSASKEMSERAICGLIISILKSLVIPGIWLALSSMIYLRITLYFALNHICSKWRHSCSKSHRFFFKSHYFCSLSHHLCFKYKTRCKSLFEHRVVQFCSDEIALHSVQLPLLMSGLIFIFFCSGYMIKLNLNLMQSDYRNLVRMSLVSIHWSDFGEKKNGKPTYDLTRFG